MNIIKIACLGITGVLVGTCMKQVHAPFHILISLTTSILIIYYSMSRLSSVFSVLNILSGYYTEQKEYFQILLKIIGITYVSEFSSNICKDAGYSAIAGQIEVFGKIAILAISTPIIMSLMDMVFGML